MKRLLMTMSVMIAMTSDYYGHGGTMLIALQKKVIILCCG